jgi:signal transduction histidine kinase
MPPTNQHIAAARKVYETYWESYTTGIGLSITHDIVKAHGGEILVNTKENEGTVFTIRFQK